MTLPIKTTVDDVRQIAGYLKTKPAGATLEEAKAVVGTKILDGRKLSAYQVWGIVELDADKYKLTERGRHLVRSDSQEAEAFRDAINAVPAYRSALEWAHHQSYVELAVDDLAANWHAYHRESLGTDNDGTIKGAVTCFFNLAAGAEMGNYVIGRGGSLTRLVLNQDKVKSLIEEGPSTPPWKDPTFDDEGDSSIDEEEPAEGTVEPREVQEPVDQPQESSNKRNVVENDLRVFITHGKNMDVVEQVKTILELADIEAEIAVESESAAIPVPDKVFGAMRNCNAAIICVSGEAAAGYSQDLSLNQNVLIEIGAAFVLYDKRVVLLWDKRIPVPSNLQGLYRCEYEGDELTWAAGMKLMKAIQGFKTK